MKLNPKKNKFLKLLGLFFLASSLFYVFKALEGLDWTTMSSFFSLRTLLTFLFLIPVYAFALTVFCFGWSLFVRTFSTKKLSFRDLFIIYFYSNIGKYLPGNFFHLIGRSLVGKDYMTDVKTLSISTFFEFIALIVISIANLILFLFLSYSFEILNVLNVKFLILVAMVFIFVLLIFNKTWSNYLQTLSVNLIIRYFLLYLVGFLLLGGVFVLMSFAIFNLKINLENILLLLSGYNVAWFVGFVTPGVPGGVGVREGMLLFLFSNYFVKEELIFLILIYRLLSIVVDILMFLVSLLFKKN